MSGKESSLATPPSCLVESMSQNLGVGTACTLLESAANGVVGSTGATLAFTCPTVRDAPAGSGIGGYQLYQAPLLPWQTASPVNCSAQ